MDMSDHERIPIVNVRNCLLVSIQVDLDDLLLDTLRAELGQRLQRDQPDGVILDVSHVGIIDSFMTRIINTIGTMARLLGARTIVAGIQPAVAITLVEMGIDLEGVETVLGIDDALDLVGIGGIGVTDFELDPDLEGGVMGPQAQPDQMEATDGPASWDDYLLGA